ncbi:MAG: hypothetical protein HY828_20930 [Actinobacteria bacterium]|nr:hypothetical protein [Actinomycetota bacterium]
MASPDEESQWQRAYDASIADQEERAAEVAKERDPTSRWAIEFRAGFFIVVGLIGLAGLGIGLLVVGPWYVSVIGAMLLIGAGLAVAGAIRDRPWRMR